MEPENVRDYATVEYWDKRYTTEPRYDWFTSVHQEVVSRMLDEIWSRFAPSSVNSASSTSAPSETTTATQHAVKVLHLGCGNSRLCHDLAAAWYARCAERGVQHFDLFQIAVDYSAVCIQNMETGDQPTVGPPVQWIVCDCRDLSKIVPKAQQKESLPVEGEQQKNTALAASSLAEQKHSMAPNILFDVVIDKGTMDALQADKESDTLEEDIDALLKETSRVLRGDGGLFLQVTWETAYIRKYFVLRDEYGWKNDQFKAFPLNPDAGGDSLYRMLRYVKQRDD